MRRYTAIKSNVYAPTSTNVIQQHMLHCHMTYHYRMMYNAKSKVDSSPPRHYKGRSFASTDHTRKKSNKYTVRPNRTKASYRAEIDLQNQLLVDRILYDTKCPPSAYLDECITQRQYMFSESFKNEKKNERMCDHRIDAINPCICQNIDSVPSLDISSSKMRTMSQFRGSISQTWTKKLASGSKRNSSLVKHLEQPQELVRNNIPRQMGKPRAYHTAQSRRSLFQGDPASVSSGSEGNAGDDEDGAPTSSYDDSNPSDSEKRKHSVGKVTTPNSSSLLKKTTNKRKGDACLCIPAIEEAKKAEVTVSEVSSRDSAYEGGEGMSSTENQRASPDQADERVCHYVNVVHYDDGSEAKCISSPSPCEKPQYCFKSEFYMKFLQDVTDDILVQGVYTNEAMERVFQEHLTNNVYSLDVNHLKLMIEKLEEDLGIPVNHCREDKLCDDDTTKQSAIHFERKAENQNVWPVKSKDFSSKVNDMAGNQFNCKSVMKTEVSAVLSPWAVKKLPIREKSSSSSLVCIGPNLFMSKRDILDNLADLDFDENMAEEIFQILAGKVGIYPDFTLKELQELVQQ